MKTKNQSRTRKPDNRQPISVQQISKTTDKKISIVNNQEVNQKVVNKSYAQAAAASKKVQQQQTNPNTNNKEADNKLNQILKFMTTFNERLNKLEKNIFLQTNKQ